MCEAYWECSIDVVYGGPYTVSKDHIYTKIISARRGKTCPLIVMGDFNEILNQSRETHGVRKFKEWINSLDLIDLPLNRRQYTWIKGNSRSKLDRFLGTNEWPIKFLELKVIGHFTEISDHMCVLLRLNAHKN